MDFIVDKQTLEDLNMLGKYRSNSIFNIFSKTSTRGAEKLLERLFAQPLSDCKSINERRDIFRFFYDNPMVFPFSKKEFVRVEQYLSVAGFSSLGSEAADIVQKKVMQIVATDKEYEGVVEGLRATFDFLKALKEFNRKILLNANSLKLKEKSRLCDAQLNELEKSASFPASDALLSIADVIKYDHLLRGKQKEITEALIEYVYWIDLYLTVASVAKQRGFGFATAYEASGEDNFIRMKQVFHPQLRKAVPNDVSVDHNKNIIFLTGANMAGKSTFMKSFAIAVYLAHMGFPVAAREMEFTVHDGLYTSINVADNLNKGYSHYYAEVLRVKEIAQEVSNGRNLVVIFDELFKGTNVKDAFEATVVVSEAFAVNRNCSYIISTHIIEAGEELREKCDNMMFVYLPTVMNGRIPQYTYQLEPGITGDRHGMMIINNEHIVEIIRGEYRR